MLLRLLSENTLCHKEPVSLSGYYGWQESNKYKMANYRTELRGYVVPEVMCNTLKRESCTPETCKECKKVSKGRSKLPLSLPSWGGWRKSRTGEDSVAYWSKEKRQPQIDKKKKMAKTFAHRKNEIINHSPGMEDIKTRWSALFEASHMSYNCMMIWNISS